MRDGTSAVERRLGFGDGLRGFFGGIGFVAATPSTWPYAAVPALAALLLACGLGALGVWGALSVPASWFGEGGWATAGEWSVKALGIAVAVIVSGFVGLALAQPLSGWALEAICSRQEEALTGRRAAEPSFFATLWISVRVTLVTLTAGAVLIGGLAVLGFVFPPAVVVTVPLKFFVAAWLLAWDFLDYPLGLRGMGIRRRAAWMARNRWAFTAFGLAWALVLLIPFVSLLVLPLGVAGAARLVVMADGEPREG